MDEESGRKEPIVTWSWRRSFFAGWMTAGRFVEAGGVCSKSAGQIGLGKVARRSPFPGRGVSIGPAFMNLPPDVECIEEAQLLIWRPREVLDEARVDRMISFLTETENKPGKSSDRFTDLSLIESVDLRFNYVFQVALSRRLSRRGRALLKSAFFVTNPSIAHYLKMAAVLTDHSPLKVALFETREAAAKWLGVAPELLEPQD